MKNQGIVAPPKETNEVLIMDPEKNEDLSNALQKV
jgi:hypothetical protein